MVADLTYVAIPSGFVYLAAILDAWSRKVVGYAIGRSMDARIAVAALKAAIRNRAPAKGCIHHSDWGGWGRLSEDGPGQHNPDPSEDPGAEDYPTSLAAHGRVTDPTLSGTIVVTT